MKADRSLQLTKESAQPGHTRHKAVEGHVHGSRCKPLGQQLHHPPIALHSCQKEGQLKLRGETGSREAVRVTHTCIPTDCRAALSSKGLIVPDESSSNWKKTDWEETIC